jgi:aminoglycoside phosphotransferase (APT) family kinase protein
VRCITRLRERNKSSVYRLHIDGWAHETVIAKSRSGHHGTADDIERLIYRDVLPAAGLPRPELYGGAQNEDETWEFMEDLGDQQFSPGSPADRRLLADWLIRLHQWPGVVAIASALPDRGPSSYLRSLQSARAVVIDNSSRPWLTECNGRTLVRLLRLLDRIERRWENVEAACARGPRTVVHGDLVGKNVRVRRSVIPELVVLDWETAGVGVPSADFAMLGDDLGYYADARRQMCPEMSLEMVSILAAAGRLFRTLAEVYWHTCDLVHPWCDFSVFDAAESRLEAMVPAVESNEWS